MRPTSGGRAYDQMNRATEDLFTEEDSVPDFLQCDGFEIALTTTGTGSGTVFFDDAGEVIKVLVRHRVRDVLTNSVTGKTVVNRGVFQETFTPIEGTDDFTATVTGFRLHGHFPGRGPGAAGRRQVRGVTRRGDPVRRRTARPPSRGRRAGGDLRRPQLTKAYHTGAGDQNRTRMTSLEDWTAEALASCFCLRARERVSFTNPG